MTIINDSFGFLPVNKTIEWNNGRTVPVSDLDPIFSEVQEDINEDGFIYPPITETYATDLINRNGEYTSPEKAIWRKKQKTKRPALLHKVPISHTIEIDLQNPHSQEVFRNREGAFLMHFIGFLYGYRLQFKDWWHDGRVYMRGRRWSFLKPGIESYFISRAFDSWSGWNESEQTRFTNILFMHCRSDLYEWDWERFTTNYMVFDACYKMVQEIRGLSYCRHPERFNVLFSLFDIPANENEIEQITALRNNLFHESLWDGGQPCSAGNNGYRQADNLKRINDRLIFAITECNTPYINSNWGSIGQSEIG